MKYKKILFVDKDGTSQAVMASCIFNEKKAEGLAAFPRGLMVPFPEPANPNAAKVLGDDNISVPEQLSQALSNNDIGEDTIVFAIDNNIKSGILKSFENANETNTFEISSYVGDEIELTNPYGMSIEFYQVCCESLKIMVDKIIKILEE